MAPWSTVLLRPPPLHRRLLQDRHSPSESSVTHLMYILGPPGSRGGLGPVAHHLQEAGKDSGHRRQQLVMIAEGALSMNH